MFIDQAEIIVRSGKGGNGMVHFHREKFVPRGGPDGGDGGRGGNVVIEVSHHLNTLVSFRHQRKYIAESGKNGGPNNMSGKSAEDLTLKVPPGTMIYNATTGDLVGDLIQSGQTLVVVKGGRGGRGNQHFATASHQVPRTAEKGEPAEEIALKLELKLLADIGIIGLPNAGKSSLLDAVSNARPKIADYPFTTLEPILGVAQIDDDTTLVLADIPGLIEGAHEGAGLGDSFLRHIQRTRVLIHLVDGSNTDPLADLNQTNQELALFDPSLTKLPQLVAINKIDLPEVQERLPKLTKQFEDKGIHSLHISAMGRINLDVLLKKAAELLQSTPLPERIEVMPVYRPKEDPRQFTIERVSQGWRLHGVTIEKAAEMTFWEHDGSVRRFQKLMEMLGVDDALREAGVQEGNTVFIGENELDWQD
jgi:GTP-binding protein